MFQYMCECDSWSCDLTTPVTDQDFEGYPTLFTESDTQFIAVGCEVGPDPGMELIHKTETFQVYKDKE